MNEHEPIRQLKRLFKRDNTLNRHEQGEILEYLKYVGIVVQGVISIPDEWWVEVLKSDEEADAEIH